MSIITTSFMKLPVGWPGYDLTEAKNLDNNKILPA